MGRGMWWGNLFGKIPFEIFVGNIGMELRKLYL
jgi:hypothetical protein